jgi:hypothetical protein
MVGPGCVAHEGRAWSGVAGRMTMPVRERRRRERRTRVDASEPILALGRPARARRTGHDLLAGGRRRRVALLVGCVPGTVRAAAGAAADRGLARPRAAWGAIGRDHRRGGCDALGQARQGDSADGRDALPAGRATRRRRADPGGGDLRLARPLPRPGRGPLWRPRPCRAGRDRHDLRERRLPAGRLGLPDCWVRAAARCPGHVPRGGPDRRRGPESRGRRAEPAPGRRRAERRLGGIPAARAGRRPGPRTARA